MSDLFTILNLFKSQDKDVHNIAYELFNNRLPTDLDREFIENSMKYFEAADHVPGKIHNLMYIKLINILDNKEYLELIKKNYDHLLYSSFVKDCVAADEGPGCDIDHERYVTHDDMYEAYKKWFKDHNLVNVCTKDELREHLKVVLKQGTCFGDKWLGRRLCDSTKFEKSAEYYFYQLFIKDEIEKADATAFITLDQLWKVYKEWYQQNSQSIDPDSKYHYTTRDDLKKKLEIVLLPPVVDKYFGVRFKENELAILKGKCIQLDKSLGTFIYSTFVRDCLRKDNNSSISHNDIYESYKTWHKEENPTTKCCSKVELKNQLEVLWSQKLVDNKWVGYSLPKKENVTYFLKEMTQIVIDCNGREDIDVSVTLGDLYKAYYEWSKDTPLTFERFSDQVHIAWNQSSTFKRYFDTHQFLGHTLKTIDNTAAIFVKTMIVEKTGLIASLDTLYNAYKKWYNQHYSATPVSKSNFVIELETVWGKKQLSIDQYYGICLISVSEEEDTNIFIKKNKIVDFIRDMIVKEENACSTLEELYNAYSKYELNVTGFILNEKYFTEQIYSAWGVKPNSDNKLCGIKLKC